MSLYQAFEHDAKVFGGVPKDFADEGFALGW
jgi:hypothetical protein